MPHVIVKPWTGRSEQQKTMIAERIPRERRNMARLLHRITVPILAIVLVTGSATVSSSETPDGGASQVVGTVVRLTAGSTSVDVTIDQDNPAVRDLLSMLPLRLTLKELNGREKIGYLPRKLEHGGSPGSDPKDGDLIYFVPWGNLGFYYNAAGIGYSDQTIHIGTYKASPEQLARLEGQSVTVAVAH